MTEISLEKLSVLVAVGEKLKKLVSEKPEVIEYLRQCCLSVAD